MNILFYTPFNSRSRDTESIMEAFVKQGHRVFLLTQTERGVYHEQCDRMGVSTFHYSLQKGNPWLYFTRHAFYLRKFCAVNKIDILYSHLETASLPAVLVQYFMRTKVVACRHVIDEAYLLKSRNFVFLNKIVYRLARNIIVVSDHCKAFMIAREKVKGEKIRVVYLAYNFKLYPAVNSAKAAEIRNDYPGQMLLLTACRLVGPKRAGHSIQVLKELIGKGLDCKLIILGEGPDFETLKSEIAHGNLADRVFLLGFKANILDYISACDLVVHPSLLDSSSVIIKEAGLLGRTVVTCRGIGDVDEYLVHGENAFLVSKDNTVNEMVNVISEAYSSKLNLGRMGEALGKSVTGRFSIDRMLPAYDKIHRELLGDERRNK